MSLLTVDDFRLTFVQYARGLRRRRLQVVTNLDLQVAAGELVAVVGSSGSGKSLLAHALLGVLPDNAVEEGTILWDDTPLTPKRRVQLRGREIALLPQSVSHLDPLATVGAQVGRAARLAGSDDGDEVAATTREAITQVGLEPTVLGQYPHELSGGMARRVLTAMATIGSPRLVVADEPTPGLDEALVTESLQQLRRLADDGAGVILITHDLAAAVDVADRIAVFYAGATMEIAPVTAFADDGEQLAHPYSRALWRALPGNGFSPLAGAQPAPDDLPGGCLFADRCPIVIDECRVARPPLRTVGASQVRCIRA